MVETRDVRVPAWGTRARRIFRVTSGVWGAMILVAAVLAIVRDRSDLDPGLPHGIALAVLVVPAVWAVAGLVWLVSAAVAGYRGAGDE